MRIFLFLFFLCTSYAQDFPVLGSLTSLDILTWNVQNYPKHNQTNSYLSDIIDQTQVDIIAFQEIENQSAFNTLINSLSGDWIGYRSGNSNYGELSYLIKESEITVTSIYEILNSDQYYFAYRPPYVLELLHGGTSYVIINNHFKCCGDGNLDLGDDGDEEYRRLISTQLLKEYVDQYYSNEKVIILGDLNDEINDNLSDNVFMDFLESSNYYFADYDIAYGSSSNWSYPPWPSHIDHIIISDELFSNFSYSNIQTFKVDSYFDGGWNSYDYYISDHRPLFIRFDSYDFIFGDINNDQTLDVLDVVLIVGLVMSEEYFIQADMNEDETLNIVDIVILINQIMS